MEYQLPPDDWKRSKVKNCHDTKSKETLKPKVSKLRPIALTNIG